MSVVDDDITSDAEVMPPADADITSPTESALGAVRQVSFAGSEQVSVIGQIEGMLSGLSVPMHLPEPQKQLAPPRTRSSFSEPPVNVDSLPTKTPDHDDGASDSTEPAPLPSVSRLESLAPLPPPKQTVVVNPDPPHDPPALPSFETLLQIDDSLMGPWFAALKAAILSLASELMSVRGLVHALASDNDSLRAELGLAKPKPPAQQSLGASVRDPLNETRLTEMDTLRYLANPPQPYEENTTSFRNLLADPRYQPVAPQHPGPQGHQGQYQEHPGYEGQPQGRQDSDEHPLHGQSVATDPQNRESASPEELWSLSSAGQPSSKGGKGTPPRRPHARGSAPQPEPWSAQNSGPGPRSQGKGTPQSVRPASSISQQDPAPQFSTDSASQPEPWVSHPSQGKGTPQGARSFIADSASQLEPSGLPSGRGTPQSARPLSSVSQQDPTQQSYAGSASQPEPWGLSSAGQPSQGKGGPQSARPYSAHSVSQPGPWGQSSAGHPSQGKGAPQYSGGGDGASQVEPWGQPSGGRPQLSAISASQQPWGQSSAGHPSQGKGAPQYSGGGDGASQVEPWGQPSGGRPQLSALSASQQPWGGAPSSYGKGAPQSSRPPYSSSPVEPWGPYSQGKGAPPSVGFGAPASQPLMPPAPFSHPASGAPSLQASGRGGGAFSGSFPPSPPQAVGSRGGRSSAYPEPNQFLSASTAYRPGAPYGSPTSAAPYGVHDSTAGRSSFRPPSQNDMRSGFSAGPGNLLSSSTLGDAWSASHAPGASRVPPPSYGPGGSFGARPSPASAAAGFPPPSYPTASIPQSMHVASGPPSAYDPQLQEPAVAIHADATSLRHFTTRPPPAGSQAQSPAHSQTTARPSAAVDQPIAPLTSGPLSRRSYQGTPSQGDPVLRIPSIITSQTSFQPHSLDEDDPGPAPGTDPISPLDIYNRSQGIDVNKNMLSSSQIDVKQFLSSQSLRSGKGRSFGDISVSSLPAPVALQVLNYERTSQTGAMPLMDQFQDLQKKFMRVHARQLAIVTQGLHDRNRVIAIAKWYRKWARFVGRRETAGGLAEKTAKKLLGSRFETWKDACLQRRKGRAQRVALGKIIKNTVWKLLKARYAAWRQWGASRNQRAPAARRLAFHNGRTFVKRYWEKLTQYPSAARKLRARNKHLRWLAKMGARHLARRYFCLLQNYKNGPFIRGRRRNHNVYLVSGGENDQRTTLAHALSVTNTNQFRARYYRKWYRFWWLLRRGYIAASAGDVKKNELLKRYVNRLRKFGNMAKMARMGHQLDATLHSLTDTNRVLDTVVERLIAVEGKVTDVGSHSDRLQNAVWQNLQQQQQQLQEMQHFQQQQQAYQQQPYQHELYAPEQYHEQQYLQEAPPANSYFPDKRCISPPRGRGNAPPAALTHPLSQLRAIGVVPPASTFPSASDAAPRPQTTGVRPTSPSMGQLLEAMDGGTKKLDHLLNKGDTRSHTSSRVAGSSEFEDLQL
ncbi:hypothetical protein DIPPA_01697 [Diplonema papillatum]|nr:hypothetical protein DIPPA_01697 [Diplonema papillatum]